jgi:dinuclear metal center YbgI/SA1388 family protein
MDTKRRKSKRVAVKKVTVATVCDALERIAPLSLAQDWDNVGLLAGDRSAGVSRVLLCIDMMPAVVREAIRSKAQLVVAYHPPIFRPITRLVAPSHGMEEGVLRCVQRNIAVYSVHTALDAAEGGTNDVLAALADVVDPQPLERPVSDHSDCKVVVFVPTDNADSVANAMFKAGGGVIGEYGSCSFRIDGTGTFFGSDATNPAVGNKGQLERVSEQRIEMVCPKRRLSLVLDAMRRAHPYEEVAHDVYPLAAVARLGMGRVGALLEPISLDRLGRKLKRRTGARCVSLVGDPERELRRAIVGAGAAGSALLRAGLGTRDVIITGELRHHDALEIERRGGSAVVLSHWSSERPALNALAKRLAAAIAAKVSVSNADAEPFKRC